MRIIAGRHRGTKLAQPAGADTRPTGDRVRESLFNILEGGRFGDVLHSRAFHTLLEEKGDGSAHEFLTPLIGGSFSCL